MNNGALLASPATAMMLLECGRTRLHELLKAGELESFRDGHARRITMRSIRAYVDRKLQQAKEKKAA